MKKLYLITSVYPYGHGEATFVLPELMALRERFEVTVISCGTGEQCSEIPEGVQVVRYTRAPFRRVLGCLGSLLDGDFWREVGSARRESGMNGVKRCLLFNSDARQFGRWLLKRSGLAKTDLVYSFWHIPVLFGALKYKEALGKPVVVARAHGFDLYRERLADGCQPFKRQCDRLLDRMFLACRAAYDYYLANYSVSRPPKCELRYLGADNDRLSPWEPSEQLRVYSCSFLWDIKRIELIIEALSLIDRPVRWVHFGDGPLKAELARLAERLLGDKPRCEYRFAGTVDNAVLRDYAANNCLDCFVTASSSEGGVPVSIVEAASFGIPAVATDAGGIPEIVRDGGGILLPRSSDARAIADALESVKRQTADEREAMRTAALRNWRKGFVASENAARFADELWELCQR